MKIYWTLISVPELKGLSKEDAQKKWREYSVKALNRWQVWAGLIPLMIILYFVFSIGEAYFYNSQLSKYIIQFLSYFIVFSIWGAIWRSQTRLLLRRDNNSGE